MCDSGLWWRGVHLSSWLSVFATLNMKEKELGSFIGRKLQGRMIVLGNFTVTHECHGSCGGHYAGFIRLTVQQRIYLVHNLMTFVLQCDIALIFHRSGRTGFPPEAFNSPSRLILSHHCWTQWVYRQPASFTNDLCTILNLTAASFLFQLTRNYYHGSPLLGFHTANYLSCII